MRPFIGTKNVSKSKPSSPTRKAWFFLHKSHLAEPQRLSNLMIAACLAYLWIVYLAVSLCEMIG